MNGAPAKTPRRIGVLGGGQLGRMLALSAHPLGIECLFLDPGEQSCAAAVGRRLRADYTDEAVLDALAEATGYVTLEFENVPLAALDHLRQRCVLRPGRASLETAQDRLLEKRCFEALGIPVAPWAAVEEAGALPGALARVGTPCVLKSRRMGYDGKGQVMLDADSDLKAAWQQIGGRSAIVEARVALAREVSCIIARAADGSLAFYPLSENRHEDGILHSARPRPDDPLAVRAMDYARRLVERLDHVGVLALELFVSRDGALLANEFAPRVHNSGHWSIEGASCSQFENHMRAVAGLPLGETGLRGSSAMRNLLGSMPPAQTLLAIPGLHLHDYGKAPRPGRKVGHVTLTADDDAQLSERESMLDAALGSTGNQT